MSAEALRQAAALMRERAEAAKDVTGASDWLVSLRGLTHAADYSVRSSGGAVAGDMAEEEAEHIASWHPAVAREVATLLDNVAFYYETTPGPVLRYSLAVATAYLGADA